MSWADIKSAARQAVHETFALPAIFYSSSVATPTVEADTVNVRLHDKSKAVGDLAGTNLSYAEVMERPTQLIFDVPELTGRTLSRGVIITMLDYSGRAVGFYVDNVNPRDGGKQTVDVSPLSPSDLAGKLLPDGTTV